MAYRTAFPSLWILVLPAFLLVGCADDGDPTTPDPPDPPADTAAAEGWEVLDGSPDAGGTRRHDDIFFLDDDTGWLINTEGQVHHTTDGGTSWTHLHTRDGGFFRSVAFANDQLGWIGSLNRFNDPQPDQALYETTDGGTTWTNISDRIVGPEAVGICGLWIADESTIYGVGRWSGPAVFIRSTDGGASWESQDLSPTVTGLVDVYFASPQEGLIIGGRGVGNSAEAQASSRTVIMGTDDGGDTWDVRYESATEGSWGWKFTFPSALVGYAAVQGPTPGGIVLKTTDGGQTWTELPVDLDVGFSGIGFATETLGWVGGDRRAVYETQDGGLTWELVRLGESMNRFRMMDSGIGFASGRRVYKYEP